MNPPPVGTASPIRRRPLLCEIAPRFLKIAPRPSESGTEKKKKDVRMVIVGGIHDVPLTDGNIQETEELARFAVDDYNSKNNAPLEFVRVVKARVGIVAGARHYLTVEVNYAGKKQLYEAVIWEQPWMKFKELQAFKYKGSAYFPMN